MDEGKLTLETFKQFAKAAFAGGRSPKCILTPNGWIVVEPSKADRWKPNLERINAKLAKEFS